MEILQDMQIFLLDEGNMFSEYDLMGRNYENERGPLIVVRVIFNLSHRFCVPHSLVCGMVI
jgi:hypothetical protein